MRFAHKFGYLSILGMWLSSYVPAQQAPDHSMAGPMNMPVDSGMKMDPGMKMDSPMAGEGFLSTILQHDTSGTSTQPGSTPTPMLMKMTGGWMLMFHGNAFLLEEQQTSARGGDKFLSTNWIMPMAQRQLGRGQLTLRAMLSLEPATITGRQYPLLFQQGETAYGKPIVDGQHPHDFFMELALLYDWHLAEKTLLSLYIAPVGDPAIGPTAYPHRESASEDPLAALGHHQEDSTHISDDVVTVGLASGIARLEASGFHGREPNEHRWQIQQGTIDSWSTRLTLQPGKNWSGQYSFGQLHSLEALYPRENQQRMTASIMYNRALHGGNWASTVLWGRTRSLEDHAIFNSYLLESTYRFHRQNSIWTRIENTDRSNELLLGENPLPVNFTETPVGRVQAYTFGYDREVGWLPHVSTALGAQVTTYGVPGTLRSAYGSDPVGVAVFLRLRPLAHRDH
ncbi:hypothetical protein ACPOL_6683 [Acidisarcina polymorpha]|uniref:Uncharacterized protein n=1 Tax=Acidisarcina polymorpha TaxID=2211140 RepID=A0A2Z5GB86_9BACT|nr:hypothetical protein [Acidisarcina polymorpha]AXC15895.1 hypothetical protein ACPOL_6683 [Acidisarcina polymorpha]